MPTQPPSRPFFASFFSAFRARTVPGSQASSMKPASSQNASTSTSSASNQPSTPRNITTTTKAGATASTLSQIHSPPLSRSPGNSPGYLTTSSRQEGISTPSSHSGAARRRGSDSSSEGANWRETMGSEKWYVGGRTATGEERYFKMGVVRRDRSLDRLSSDRLSL